MFEPGPIGGQQSHRHVDRLVGVFVNTGLWRKNEFEKVLAMLRDNLHLNVRGVDASGRFLNMLAGVADPEKKRKLIGNEFIRVFEEEAHSTGAVDFLVQGTLYPDVIESVSVKGPSQTIKSHHNVGGLPERMHLKLVEPLRELFKDEVRALGRELGLPREFISRHPFPGPGLAIRCLGEVTAEKLAILRKADAIFRDEIEKAGFKLAGESSVWRNPADTRDWNAAPFAAKDKRGHSDRFALKYVKP